jgi:preprotein translocase subunit SecB
MDKIRNSKFKYKLPILKSIIFKVNEDFKKENVEDVIVHGNKKINRSNDEATVFLELSIYEEDNKEYPFFLSIAMEGKFSWEDDIGEDMINLLLNENAPSVLVSFMRSHVVSLTTGAGYDSFVLPLLDFTSN